MLFEIDYSPMHVIRLPIGWLWLLENGFPTVGYHNGGLCLKDRNIVEGLFLKGDIQVLCTTNTLAHGINLPAHTVVIKSTQHLYVIFFYAFHSCTLKNMFLQVGLLKYYGQQQGKMSLYGIWSLHYIAG